MLRTFAEKVSPHNAAVLVVDVQNDYCAPGGGLAKVGVDMSAIEACIPRVAVLVEGAREVGVPVIHIRTHHEAATEVAGMARIAPAKVTQQAAMV